tara:strand:- start:217 stop:447 length:231 start_codon:yes stop_codon:yes gene_type:complete
MAKIITTYIDPKDIYKRVTVIEDENGKRHRKILSPNDDISNEDINVQNVCNENWTDELKASWNNYITEKQNNIENS